MQKAEELQNRTRTFAIRILELCRRLPQTPEGDTIRRQLAKAGTGVSANYRAACRSRSHPEFVARIGIVEEEADEAVHWLEVIVEANLLTTAAVQDLPREAHELRAIFATSHRTAKRNLHKRSINKSTDHQINKSSYTPVATYFLIAATVRSTSSIVL
jgi:four helix bundle protein